MLRHHVLPHAGLKAILTHPLGREHCLIPGFGKLAIFLKCGDTRNEPRKLLITYAKPAFLSLLRQQAAADQGIQHHTSYLRCFKHRQIDLSARLGTQAVLLLIQCCKEFLLGNLGATHRSDIGSGIRIADIRLNTPQREWHRNKYKKTLHNPLVVTDIV